MPSLETSGEGEVASGLVAEMTCGSLATLAMAPLTAVACAATVPLGAWKTICPL